MKIVEIIPQLSSGGAERFVVDLCNELARLGHDVVLLSLLPLDDNAGHNFFLGELTSDVRVVSLDKGLGFDGRLFALLSRLVKEEQPDVVHSHLRAFPYLMPLMLTNRKIKHFHTIHNDAQKEASDIFNRITRKFAFKFGLCHPITISAESDRSFINYYGADVRRTLIFNGSPARVANPDNAVEIVDARNHAKIMLVNIARVMPQKNQMALVESMRAIPEVELFIIGNDNGEYADSVKAAAPKNVHFLGQKKNPRDYMAAADAFVLSSFFEGMPISLIECFSVGAIPIVTPVGGMINMIKDGENGIITDDVSSCDIYRSIIRFLSMDEKEREILRKGSYESFSHYTIMECAKNYLKIFSAES